MALARYNQCPIPVSSSSFTNELNVCRAVDELNENYYIIKNVPSLANVRYFFFTEKHDIAHHHQLKSYFANRLGKKGDLALFEREDASWQAPCEKLCVTYGGRVVVIGRSSDVSCVPNTFFSKKLICRGWDNADLVDEALELMLYPSMRKQFDQVAINKRNKEGMMKTLDGLQNTNKTVFVFPGTKHLLADEAIFNDADPSVITMNDRPFELRKYLEKIPHAILIPHSERSSPALKMIKSAPHKKDYIQDQAKTVTHSLIVEAKTLPVPTKGRAIQLSHQVKPLEPLPISSGTTPMGLINQLTIGACLMYCISKCSFFTMPWNRERNMTMEEIKELKQDQRTLDDLHQRFAPQKISAAAKSGLFDDQYKFIERNLSELDSEITHLLKKRKVTKALLNSFKQKIATTKEMIHVISLENRKIKKIATKDRRLHDAVVVITRDVVNHTLKRDVVKYKKR